MSLSVYYMIDALALDDWIDFAAIIVFGVVIYAVPLFLINRKEISNMNLFTK